MNSPAIDIKNFFVEDKIGYFIGDNPQNPFDLDWAIGIQYEPQKPNKFITIYDSIGVADIITNSKQFSSESVQIRVRDVNYLIARNKIEAIREYLNGKGKTPVTGEGYRYEGFYQESTIQPLGKDEDDRWILTINYKTLRYV